MTCLIAEAYAVVNVDRTRVIFSAGEMAQSLNLSNDGETPAIIQVWTDTGDPLVPPDKVSTPIVSTPPVFKMLPKEIRSLRLLLTARQGLPNDRESVFWLNIFQIQPESERTRQNAQKLILPLRLRMKVFIRPADIGDPDALQYQTLQFSAHDMRLIITNPTPWNISLNVEIPGQRPLTNIMVSPRAEKVILPDKPLLPGKTIAYRVITDDGNYLSYQAVVRQ